MALPLPADFPAPVAPTNQWACGLASLCWNLQKCGQNCNQETLISFLFPHFPHWALYPGMLDFTEILIALKYLKVNPKTFAVLPSKQQFLDFVGPRMNDYLMGFVRTKKASFHIMPIVVWSGDEVKLMDAATGQSHFVDHPWDVFVGDSAPSFLVLIQ